VISLLVSGSDLGSADNDPTALPGAGQLKAACPTLAGRIIPATSIGLTSGDAGIVSAAIVDANAATTPATPEFCKVIGSISPIDPAAQLINSRSICRSPGTAKPCSTAVVATTAR
jgi:hypothetical protein